MARVEILLVALEDRIDALLGRIISAHSMHLELGNQPHDGETKAFSTPLGAPRLQFGSIRLPPELRFYSSREGHPGPATQRNRSKSDRALVVFGPQRSRFHGFSWFLIGFQGFQHVGSRSSW